MGIDNPTAAGPVVLTPPTANLFLWYHADQLTYADGTALYNAAGHTWPPDPISISNRILGEGDALANTNPLFKSLVDGFPAVQFLDRGSTGCIISWAFPNPFTAFTGADGCEFFYIIKTDFDPPTDPLYSGLATFSSGVDYNEIYRWPGLDANHLKVFSMHFSVANHDMGTPAANLAAWQTYSLKSKTNLYHARISGTDIFNTAVNTFDPPGAGTGFRVGIDRNAVYLHGYIRDIIIYNNCDATATRAQAVEAYANQKYGI